MLPFAVLDRAISMQNAGQEKEPHEKVYMRMPDGWVVVRHVGKNWNFFYHAESNVCTWSRPYVLPKKRENMRKKVSFVVLDDECATFTLDADACKVLSESYRELVDPPPHPTPSFEEIRRLEYQKTVANQGFPPPEVRSL
jgi:hypothetical protein